jgi:glycosyltransferase involved in cell wall biosynthesis
MKLVAITLYPNKKAGSATYSYKLYKEISKQAKVVIFGDEETERKNTAQVVKAWHRNSMWTPFKLFTKVLKENPQVCHFQIEYRTFNDNAMLSSLEFLIIPIFLAPSSIKTFTTLHGVISLSAAKEFYGKRTGAAIKIPLRLFYKTLEVLTARIIVHTWVMKKVLQEEYGVNNDKIVIISHGVDRARHSYEMEDTQSHNLLFHGFLRSSKGLECLLNAMKVVLKRHPEARLTIAGGAPHQDRENTYIIDLEKKIETMQLDDQVKIIRGFLSENKLEELIVQNDILLFPYIDNFVEASGALARAMDYGKAVICTRTPRFIGDLEDEKDCLMIPPNNDAKLAEAIIRLIENKDIRERIKCNLKRKASDRYWDIMATKHLQLFEEDIWT